MSTSEAPAMTQAAIRKLVADSVTTALEAQAANMANTDNTTRPREAHLARQCSYKEFMSCQPINFKGTMELENSQNNALAKLPMLKLGEYEMWEIRIKQYFQIQDYALWEARILLLMALPNEHQLTFNQYVDAQSMFAAIKARFGGIEATKRTQKALLKQTQLKLQCVQVKRIENGAKRELSGSN
ncbi:hypothetical protein Tco_1102277 [Tanacetum coccineum]